MNRRTIITALLFLLSGPVMVWGQTRSILIFNYFTRSEGESSGYAYLEFTLPDIIRESLLDSNQFFLFEKSSLSEFISENGMTEEAYKEDEFRLKAARDIGSDYFIWGYYLVTEEAVIVTHHLVETYSGRTLQMKKKELPLDKTLFPLMEEFSGEFSEWVNRELPDRELSKPVQETVVIQTIEVPVESEPPGDSVDEEVTAGSAGFYLGADFHYQIFIRPFSEYIQNAFAGSLYFDLTFPEIKPFYFGISLSLSYLESNYQQLQNGAEINVMMLPIVIRSGILYSFPLDPFPWLGIESWIDLGASLLFGRQSENLLTNLRFSAGGGVSLVFFPEYYISFGVGIRCLATVHAYDDWTMFWVAPVFQLTSSF